MRFASLGSGSDGNALVVEADGSRLMLDCGLGLREVERRLARLGLAPADLEGVVVTHEHGDHASGALAFAQRHRLRVWMTHGTWRAIAPEASPDPGVNIVDSHGPFAVAGVEVHPFPVPHDAREPVQFVFSDGDVRLGVLTDAGTATPHIEAMLSGCEALVLECNHDAGMLERGPYPARLKERIRGPYGHLANDATAELLAALDHRRLRHVVAAHLSRQNNTPELARAALAGALGCALDWIGVADQDDGFGWRALR
ncbi:MAG: MBL fold metallo-hydrolase [Burkholderiales bacterium]|nr:MBL fold metallo-hydrolase [Burkholderiales bacterium]